MPEVPLLHRRGSHAAMPEWHAIGGQCIVVQETSGSNPGEPLFLTPPFPRRFRRLGLNKQLCIAEG